MATANSPRSIELRELLEVSIAAVERAMLLRRGRFPFQVTVGMILDPRHPFPEGSVGDIPDAGGDLTPQDHTLIVRAVMDNAVPIARVLGLQNTKFTDDEALTAALQINAIDASVKARIRAVLSTRKSLQKSSKKIPSRMRDHMSSLRERLAEQKMPDKVAFLRRVDLDEEEFSREALDVAARILEDGIDTIYNPADSFYQQLREGPRAVAKESDADVEDVANIDTVGGAIGAGLGSVLPGVGTAAGGVAVGAGASAGAIVGKVIAWLRD